MLGRVRKKREENALKNPLIMVRVDNVPYFNIGA